MPIPIWPKHLPGACHGTRRTVCQSVARPLGRHDAAESVLVPDGCRHRHGHRRAARALARRRPWRCCCRPPTSCRRRARSSCWPASTTARSTAARPRRSSSTCRARRARSSLRSTATRWRARVAPDRRSPSPPSAPSSPARVATLAIAIAAPPLTKLAQQFAPADYFSLMALGLVFAVVLARGSALKAFGMIFLGMLLGLVGTDVNTGNTRFTFDISDLFDGIGFVPLVMGMFGIAEIMHNLTNPQRRDLVSCEGQRADARRARTSSARLHRSCAAPRSAGCSASCPAAGPCSPRSRPTRWRRSCRRRRRNSAPA